MRHSPGRCGASDRDKSRHRDLGRSRRLPLLPAAPASRPSTPHSVERKLHRAQSENAVGCWRAVKLVSTVALPSLDVLTRAAVKPGEPGAVRRAEIGEDDRSAMARQTCVLARNGAVAKDNVDAGTPAEDDRVIPYTS